MIGGDEEGSQPMPFKLGGENDFQLLTRRMRQTTASPEGGYWAPHVSACLWFFSPLVRALDTLHVPEQARLAFLHFQTEMFGTAHLCQP